MGTAWKHNEERRKELEREASLRAGSGMRQLNELNLRAGFSPLYVESSTYLRHILIVGATGSGKTTHASDLNRNLSRSSDPSVTIPIARSFALWNLSQSLASQNFCIRSLSCSTVVDRSSFMPRQSRLDFINTVFYQILDCSTFSNRHVDKVVRIILAA